MICNNDIIWWWLVCNCGHKLYIIMTYLYVGNYIFFSYKNSYFIFFENNFIRVLLFVHWRLTPQMTIPSGEGDLHVDSLFPLSVEVIRGWHLYVYMAKLFYNVNVVIYVTQSTGWGANKFLTLVQVKSGCESGRPTTLQCSRIYSLAANEVVLIHFHHCL